MAISTIFNMVRLPFCCAVPWFEPGPWRGSLLRIVHTWKLRALTASATREVQPGAGRATQFWRPPGFINQKANINLRFAIVAWVFDPLARQFQIREERSVEERCKAEALRIYKARASERNLHFDMRDEDFFCMIDEPCHHCGAERSRHTTVISGRWRYTHRHNGIGRDDDLVGYYLFNCVACCIRCNRSKGKMEEHEWLDRIMRIANRLREREPNRPAPLPEVFGEN